MVSSADTGRIFVLDLTVQEQGVLDLLLAQWRAKRPRNNMRTAFYDMRNSEAHLMGAAIPDVVRRRRFVLGWSAIAVDKLARRCNLETFYDASGADLDSLGLPQLIADNRLRQEISQGATSSLMHAVSFIVTTLGDTAAGEPKVLMNTRDATTATGDWDVRRRALRSFLSLTKLSDQGEPLEMTLYLPNLNIFIKKASQGWTVERRSHIYGVPVDPMRYKPRAGREFGSSRITRTVMSLHEQALATMIRADVNGEAYSLPRYALLGAGEEAFQNADGSPKPTWQAAWDAIWAIGDDEGATNPRADVKQFSGQSPEPQNAHLRMLAQLFSGETGIPVGELGITGDSNPTSAEALLVSRDDLIIEANQTMDNWSPDVSSAATRGLRMLHGDDLPDDLRLESQWRRAATVSPSAAADAAGKVFDKLPWLAETEVGLEMVGLTSDQARRAVMERRRSQGSGVLAALRDRAATEPLTAPSDDLGG